MSGEIGPHDGSPFVRASFASSYGAAGYCKVESLTSAEGALNSMSTTTVRRYSATSVVVTVPVFTFTHLTSDGSGPC